MSSSADDIIVYEMRLGDLIEQLEVNGVRVDQLGEADVERLREILECDSEVQWELFVAAASAAERFAGKSSEPGPEPIERFGRYRSSHLTASTESTPSDGQLGQLL